MENNTDTQKTRPESVIGKKVSSVGYDIVLCTKRLVRAFDDPACARRCASLMVSAMAEIGIAESEVDVHGDYVLLTVRGVPASLAPSKAAAHARLATSATLRSEFDRISSLSSLWDSSLLVRNAGDVSREDAEAFKNSLDTRKSIHRIPR